ncbi:MAG: hypothetical protein H0X41_04610, partial [Chitinophagaceae bacterium]|nr:hypothetical protein [Chitinophagaceae bacterium]
MPENRRRTFIKKGMLGAASAITLNSLDFSFDAVQKNDATHSHRTTDDIIQLGKDVQVELLISGNRFLGIGSVKVNKVSLRDSTIPMCCEIRNPDGISVTDFIVTNKRIKPEGIEIEMSVHTKRSGMMDWMLHTVRNRENLYGWSEEKQEDHDTTVTLKIFPVSRAIGNYRFTGFSYQYIFKSRSFPVYKILDRGTWEISGSCIGCESWMRVGHVPSIVPFVSDDQKYSTENYYHGIANPNVFQFLPLQTELQGFTFQAHSKGILVTWPTQVAHVRTLLEKPRGSARLFHFHQHCNDLSHDFATSPVEVLFLPETETDSVSRYNIYESVRQYTHTHLHEHCGIRQERISTYGQIEQWDEPDFDDYTDRILPALIEKGVRRIFIPNEFENTMNTWGLSNMCCNVDFKISKTVGAEKIAKFCKTATQAGIEVMMWGNTAISTLTEMFQWKDGKKKRIDFLPEANSIMEVIKKAKEPFVRNPSNAIEADHYTPRFAALNLRDPDIKAYWMRQWKLAYDIGIHGIFLDSSFNMSSDKFHFVQNTEQHADSGNEQPHDFYRPEKEPPKAIKTQY